MIGLKKVNLKGLAPQTLREYVVELGEPSFRAAQLMDWIYRKKVNSFGQMTNLPKALRQKLDARFYISHLEMVAREVSADDTVKYLFRLEDGHVVETVLMDYDYGRSVCVSTQVGCRMGCRFCASTIGGWIRNLSVAEIVDQVLELDKELKKKDDRVRNVVIMGTGEPLENYEAVLDFIRLINLPETLKIGIRHITLSTCGLVPEIRRLAREGLGITLAVSLHAPNDELRDWLMPVNRRYPLRQLLEACKEYTEITGRRITFEYALIDGINDSDENAVQLAGLLKGMLAHVNLIPLNPVPEREFRKSPPARARYFASILSSRGIAVTLRRELGADINAACGQLRRRFLQGGSQLEY